MRTDNISMLHDTLHIMEQGYYTIGDRRIPLQLSPDEMREIMVFLPDDVANITASKEFPHVHVDRRVGVECVNADSYTLARQRMADLPEGGKPVLVLNLANPVHPGGGVRRGAKAQEEDLCRKSSLLLSLESNKAAAYYRYNESLHTYMGSDAIMVTPKVEIIKDDHGALLPESVIVSVMTCAAPMLRYGLEGMTEHQYQEMVYRRITGMLKVAAHLGYQNLVLGAFGCGAFDNDAHAVSDLFCQAMREFDYDGMRLEDLFRRIDYAVMDHSADQYNYREFARTFNLYYGN